MTEEESKTTYLYQIESLKKDDTDIGQIVNDLKNHIKDQEPFEYDRSLLEKKNFIITPNSIERIRKISYYVSRGVPVLLEGPSGTSKTFSTEFACLLAKTKKELIRFNMSSDTVPADLLGKMVGDKNSLAGISSQEGHFLKAFKDGHPLLLDEINLASQAVLQCIEEALDSEIISIEIPGFPLTKIKKHPDFALIATQNPNKGLFANKRQNLGKKFMSKFQVITFPEFSEDELNKIAIGLGKSFGFTGDKKILEDLVKFHKAWASSEEIKDDVQCFTVREIAASVKAFSEGMNLYDTIMTIYGARYQKSLKDKLSKMLRFYDSFKDIQPEKLIIPSNFPKCYQNTSLLQAIKSIKFSLDNNRHVIISGNEGTGKTQLALWFAEWYGKERNIKKSNIFYCLCTEELKCPDLIGRQSPTNSSDPGRELIEWKNGFLSVAIENGGVVVLDALDQATATVTERLNGLLDQKYDDTEKAKFDVPENPQKPEILIDKNFRLVCTTDINKINQMSPAFVNRFDVIVLEDQMENITEEEKKELIKFLLINSYKENKVKALIAKQENQEKEKEEVIAKELLNIDFSVITEQTSNKDEFFDNQDKNLDNTNENFLFGQNEQNNFDNQEQPEFNFEQDPNQEQPEFNFEQDQNGENPEFNFDQGQEEGNQNFNFNEGQNEGNQDFNFNEGQNEENQNNNFEGVDDLGQQNLEENIKKETELKSGENEGQIDNNIDMVNDENKNIINEIKENKEGENGPKKELNMIDQTQNNVNQENKDKNNEYKEEIVEETYNPNEELINLVYNKSNEFKTIYKLNQFCRTIRIFINYFKDKEEITQDAIVSFCFNILTKDFEKGKLVEIDPKIESILLDLNDEPPSDDPKYFYKNSKLLSNYIAVLHACKIANIHLCVYGPPGAGKTSGTRAFGRIISKDYNKRFDFEMHSFHAGTKPSHYYGTTTLKDGKIYYKNGTLTNSLINGYMFIADELNLSSISNMNALAPALENGLNHSIFFPGIENPIEIHPNFFFVVCQNEVGTIGRNTLPQNIIRRFKEIFYPPQQVEDISQISKEINCSLYKPGEDKVIDDKTAEKLGEFMIKLNEQNYSEISQWSLRDINKLFQRHIQQFKTGGGVYQNISFCHNLLFYTLSSVSKEEIPNVKEKVIKIIQDVYGLTTDERNNLSNDFNSKAELKNDSQGSLCIFKGNCSISFELFKQIFITADKPNIEENPIMKLNSLLEDLFQISLTSDKEPILLIGPSGYKTFLAQKFLSNAKTITLNQESSVEQLLGASTFFSKSEVNDFYLRLIVLICRLNNYNELNDKLKQGTLTKKEINDIIDSKKVDLPDSFIYAINRCRDKIFMKKKDDEESNALSNMIIEFRPGLFLTAILGGSCLILKNLSNLPTIILERFNELFSGKCNITVNEDIPNTITPESNKELSEFNKNFRVFGTCPPGATSQLSEAVISRFSLIYVGEYKIDEQKTVLQSYCDLNKLNTISDENINNIIEYSQSMNTSFSGVNFTLYQMINLLQLAHDINTKLNKYGKYQFMTRDIVLSLIFYYSARGLLDNRDQHVLKRLCDIVNINEPPENALEKSKSISPVYIDEENGVKGLRSKITHLIINSPYIQEIDKDIAFTTQFNEMLEIIHFGLVNNVPVILEGMPGQGKQTCINYISEMLGYEVVNIMISQSTKVEDLLGKNVITKDKNKNIKVILNETKLSKALKKQNDGNGRELIFVFNNLNNASPAVLELLTSIFDKNQQNVLLSDGSTIPKNPINIIGILKPQNGANRDKLPPTLVYSSIYHIVLEQDEQSIKEVIAKKLEKEEFKGDAAGLYNNYIKAKDIIEKKYQKENFLNFNDISKFINFRKISYGKINDVSIIFAMVFVYRFTEEEIINDLKQELQIQSIDMKPSLIYDQPIGTLTYKIGEKNKIQIKTFFNRALTNEEKKNFNSHFVSLTSNQKSCILFLILCALTKRSSLIQGETASGKSHVIRTFAYLMGKELNVYQLNSESSTSLLTGQSKLNTKITKEESEELGKIFENLKSFEKIKDKINENFIEGKYEEWTAKSFKDLIDLIKEIESKANAEEKDLLKKSRIEIGKIIIPANRFNNDCDSAFVISMKKGYWDLFDGIESATPQLSEKISTLAGEEPELDLFEKGKDNYFFTRKDNIPNSTKINEDFLMFICHNISSQSDKSLDPSLLSKCICFCMPPVDSKEIDSAQILYGSLIKNNLERKICQSNATRLSFVHKFVKDKSKIEEESFSGDLQPTGRTLGFIGKEFRKYLEINKFENPNLEIYRPICHSLISFYANSYNPMIKDEEGKTIITEDERNKKELELKDKFVDELVNKFRNYVPDFNLDEVSQDEKYLDILLKLKKIQEYAISEPQKREKFEFNFSSFVEMCIDKTELGDIDLIIKHLSDTVELLSKMKNPTEEKEAYYQLNMLNKLFKDINDIKSQVSDQYIGRKLSDKELLQIEVLKVPLSRLHLFEGLAKNKEIFSGKIKSCLFVNNLSLLTNSIIDLYTTKNTLALKKMLHILRTNPHLFTIMDLIFPYKHFSNTIINNITYLMNLFTKLYISKINFKIIIDKNEFLFQTSNNPLKMICIFYINSKFLLDINTTIQKRPTQNDKAKDLMRILQNQIKNPNKDYFLWNYYIYLSILEIIDKKKEETIDDKEAKVILSKYYGKIIEKPKLDKNYISFHISNFFANNEKASLFGKAWGCIFNFDKSLLNYIKGFSYQIEKHLINLADILNQIIEPKYIEPIINLCESMKDFCSNNSILWQIHTGNFRPESSKASIYNISIKKEKAVIDGIFNQEIQFNEDIKVDFQNCFNAAQKKIDELILIDEKDENLKKLKLKLNENKNKLNAVKTNDKKILMVKNQLTAYISQFSDNNQITLTEDIVNDITNKVNNFIDLAKQNVINKEENLIDWPDCIVKHPNVNESENTNNIDILIWYSKIVKELKIIDIDITKNLLKSIVKLNEDQEILPIINLLMNINNDKVKNIDPKSKQIIYGTLNAFFIFKLYKQQRTSFLWNIGEYINNFKKREEINEPYFISKVDDYLKSLEDKFILYIPKFKKTDLLFLFINVVKNDLKGNKEYKLGPLLSEFNCYNVIRGLNPLIDQLLGEENTKTCVDILDDVAKAIYLNYLKSDEKKEDIKTHESIVDALKRVDEECNEKIEELNKVERDKSAEKYNQDKKIRASKILLSIMELAKLMDDKFPQCKLEFDDIEFFDDKFGNELINNFPTLFYFFNKNLLTYQQIKDNFIIAYKSKKLHNDDNEFYQYLYYWIFALRILSSMNCIYLEQYNENFVEFISSEVRKLIKEKLYKKDNFGTKWINICFDNIDPLYEDNNISTIYKYIKRIIAYSSNVKPEFKNECISLLKKELVDILKLVFSNSIDNFMNKGFSNPDKLTKFFIDPDSELKIEIENDVNEKYKEIIESELYVRELKPFYDSIVANFAQYKKEIETEAEKEKKFTEEQFIQEKEKERIRLINDKKDKMDNLINEYKKAYGELCDKYGNSLLLKVNGILRKIITFANKNTPIEEIIAKNKLILEELKGLDELIEKEVDNNLKNRILNVIKELEECDKKLYNIKDYNKYQFINKELYKKVINENPGIHNMNKIEKSIQEHIDVLSKYESDEDQELVNIIIEKLNIFKDLLINIKDIKTIYHNYCCDSESEKYLNQSQKIESDLKSKKLEKEEIDKKINEAKEKNDEDNQKLQEINQKREELKNNLQISEEDKIKLENDMNMLKKEQTEILDLQKKNQKSIEEYEHQISIRIEENGKLFEEYSPYLENPESKIDFINECEQKIAQNNKEIEKYKYDLDSLLNIMQGKKEVEEERLKEIETLLKVIEQKISDFDLMNNEIEKYKLDIKKIEDNHKLEKKNLNYLNNKLKELEKTISELESQYSFNKEMSIKESIKKTNIDIKETCMKNKEINKKTIEKELNDIFLSLKQNASKIRSKLFMKKLDPLIKPNYAIQPHLLLDEINTKIFFLEEYNDLTLNYLKINELFLRIKNAFNDNSFKILFSNESIKALCISYSYPEGDTRQKRIQIYDIYNNFINFESKKSGNIFLNFNYYDDKVKIDFYNYTITKNDKSWSICNTGKEINILEFYKINDLKTDEAIEKILEETKSYDYKKDCPHLQFGIGQNLKNEEHFFQMLDEYFDILKKLKDIFTAFEEDKTNNSIEGVKKIIEDIKKITDELFNKTDELNNHFKVEFTNIIYKCLGTQEKIDDLGNKISQLKEYINKLLNLIDGKKLISKVNKLKGIKKGYEFFNKKLNLYLPEDKPSNKKVNFSELNVKSDLLKLPIISIVNNAVSCSYPNLKLNFGPYIYSLYQEPIQINFTSLVKTLSMRINNIEKEYIGLLKCYVNNSNGLAQLEITIPKISGNEKDKELYNIKCQIEFNSPGSTSCLLDCEFNIEVIPFNIIAYCKEYNLAKIDNENYTLCLTNILSGSSINLFLLFYNIDKELNFTYKIESVENNTSEKPDIKKDKNHLELTLGKKEDNLMRRLRCKLFINFNNNFNLIINIDCYLVPFVFKFEVYDYNNKTFNNNIDLYIKGYQEIIKDKYGIGKKITKIKPNHFPLHFQVILPNYSHKGNVEFSTSGSYYVSIKNNNVPKIFEDNFSFDLDLYIDDDIMQINNQSGRKSLNESCFILKLKLNNTINKIIINFKIYEKLIQNEKYVTENIYRFHLEKCLIVKGKETWEQVKIKNNENKADLNATHVSMYGLEQIFYLYYKDYDRYNYKEYLSITTSENHLLSIKFSKKFLAWGTKIEYKLINGPCYYYDNINNIGIIGFIGNSTDLWYPAFYKYDEIFNQLNEKEKKINNYKNVLYNIVNKYEYDVENSIISGTYSVLAYKIAKLGSEWDNKDKIPFLKKLLSKISEILNKKKILEQIQKLDKLDTDSNIDDIDKIYVNTIYLLYITFKKRYEFIRNNKFTIILSSLNAEKLNAKSEELLKKYYYYDKTKTLDKTYILNSFKFNKDILTAKEMYKKLPTTQNKAIIYKEGTNSLLSDKITTDFSLSKSSLNKGQDLENITTFKTEIIPNIIYPQEWSIITLNDFFMKSIKGTRELPLFAISAKLEKDTNGLQQTENLYIKLLDLFENSPEVDDSLIGELIMTFNDQFTKMTNNLLNSNIIFKEGILPKKLKTNPSKLGEINNQYIISPKEIIINELYEKQWEANNISMNKDKKTNTINAQQLIKTNLFVSNDNIAGVNKNLLEQKEKLKREEEERKKREQQKILEKQKSLKREESKIFEQPEDIPKLEKDDEYQQKVKKEDLVSNFRIKFKQNRKSSHNETFNLNKDNSEPSKNDNPDMEVNIDTSIKKENIKIDVSEFNFNDEILLKLVIERMKEIEDKLKNNKKLPELGIKKDLKGQPDYRNEQPSCNNFNIIELYQRGMILANKLIKNLSEKRIPFSQISVNLLIDCSGFINLENKLKQLVIICGIVNALNIVNILYAISLVGDSQFECTLKPFDKEHSMENLQKVLDCLFIKRFIAKNANGIQYALKYTKANSTHRVILMFTDGLDEDFLLIQSWKDKLFINPNYSFGFFFINSENVCNKHSEDLDYLKVKWDEFKKEIRDTGINIEIKYYKSTFEDANKLYDDIADIVSNLLERPIDEIKLPIQDDIEFNPPTFDLSQEENLDSILLFDKALEESYENKPEIYIKKTDVLKNITNKVYKLNANPYKNKLSKITKYEFKDDKIKAEIHSYAKKYIENRAKLNKAKIEAIFKPNKPSQKVLSTTGTEFDIPALIMNLINPSPDPMIYLEEKGGMIRNYSVSLVLDTSYSCFNPLCTSFSLQNLRLMLSTLTSIDLPCFDFILARQSNPEILCSNLSSVRAINSKSALWESLISILSHPCSKKSDLASAIEAAFDLKRMRSSEYTSYLFVLTDGLYQETEYRKILRAVSNCVKSGLNVFGIGIGIYPVRIENLFPKVIYCHNPYNLNKAIANFFGESISGVKDTMIFMDRKEPNHTILLNNSIAEVINESTNTKNYQSLFNKLNEVIVETDAFLLISNQEDDMEDAGNVKSNPTGEGKELLKKDQLKGHRILVVMLWSKTLNSDENQCIHKDYITKVSPESKACLKDALDFLGITIDIVENYRDAITKLTSKNENGKCPYYSCWIINGPPYEDLPDGSNEAFLFGQFLEVLKLFWEVGGALVFLAEGWKLQYQTNEFLKMLDFDGKKIEFYLVGDDEEKGTKEHVGGKNLTGDKSGKLENKQQFSKKIERYGGIQRLRLDHNLFTLFEGDTICYASTDDYNKLLPFHPFSRDSDNGISSLFYLSDEKKRGDIFIDCGFTKLFINMEKDDTAFRYFQNIASWSARTEIHMFYDNKDIKEWRPECINYKIDLNKKWTNFKPKPSFSKKVDLTKLKNLFAFDNSGSISGNSVYFNEINRIVNKYYKPGDKFYLWGSRYTEKSKSEIDQWIRNKNGPEGTNSVYIAELAKACPNHREHLIIVTDGKVGEGSIRRSDELMQTYNIKFQFVSVYVVGRGGNLSVGAPFCRGCPNRTIHVLDANNRINGPSLSLDEIAAFNSINNINSISDFNNKFNKLYSAIKAKQLGKSGDTDIKNKLSSLKNRIINNLNGTAKADFEKKWNDLNEMATNGVHDFKIGTAGIKHN